MVNFGKHCLVELGACSVPRFCEATVSRDTETDPLFSLRDVEETKETMIKKGGGKGKRKERRKK